MITFRLCIVLIGMILIPGWFALAVTGLWRRWPGLQSWIVAAGIGIAFYPVLLYTSRFLLPFLTFGPYKMSALLLLLLAITIWRLRHEWRKVVSLDLLEWTGVAVFAATLFTRFWIIRDRPFPAWTDSLHHTLLTQLTAVQGQLPATLEPYFPVSLDQYHLGLYAITAAVQWLAQVPAHTALLWTAQTLNGLCGLGVYLVLDRKVGRVGAIIGAVVAGLLLHQPALYVNWGRFTQISGQTILLLAWLVTWEAVENWARAHSKLRRELFGQALLAALLTSAIFLLHFRVAAFYLPLLGGSVLWVLWRVRQERRLLMQAVQGASIIAAFSLLLVMPALVEAVQFYVADRMARAAQQATQPHTSVSAFYLFPLSSFPYLIGGGTWLLGATGVAALIGSLRRNGITLAALVWTVCLFGLGYIYLLRIPLLNFTNLGAILIMLYLPIGLVLGSAVEELLELGGDKRVWLAQGMIVLFLLMGLVTARDRATMVEDYRYFITSADLAAMEWINTHTAPDALFAINTYFWLPGGPHGTDAGYWIPYFTGRQTTASMMLFTSSGTRAYRAEIVAKSQAAERLENDPTAVVELQTLGVDYIYIGQRGDFASIGLKAETLREFDGLEEVYARDGVSIFHLTNPAPTSVIDEQVP